jgi:hypothetical protein
VKERSDVWLAPDDFRPRPFERWPKQSSAADAARASFIAGTAQPAGPSSPAMTRANALRRADDKKPRSFRSGVVGFNRSESDQK